MTVDVCRVALLTRHGWGCGGAGGEAGYDNGGG